jgi:hypothetical protein
MKETAVEFLIEELNNIKSSSTDQYGKITFLEKEFNKLIEQAKEREKEQITEAYEQGYVFAYDQSPEEYYNETFKNKIIL